MNVYLKVRWLHKFEKEPFALYSELDIDLCEIRKVEIFRGGKFGFASSNREYGGTFLSSGPCPPIEEINRDKQFDASEISREEFEKIWEDALNQSDDQGLD